MVKTYPDFDEPKRPRLSSSWSAELEDFESTPPPPAGVMATLFGGASNKPEWLEADDIDGDPVLIRISEIRTVTKRLHRVDEKSGDKIYAAEIELYKARVLVPWEDYSKIRDAIVGKSRA